MFTGIVQGCGEIILIKPMEAGKQFSIAMTPFLVDGLQVGASVSVDGVCLTVVSMSDNVVVFDLLPETLDRTTLKCAVQGRIVNIERAAKFGDEIGGHFLSGHVFDTAEIISIETTGGNAIVAFQGNASWSKYLFQKGYIAIDGISLTLVEVRPDAVFTVHLIPETLRLTTLGRKHVGDRVNIEIDAQIQAIVDTIERIDGRSSIYDRSM